MVHLDDKPLFKLVISPYELKIFIGNQKNAINPMEKIKIEKRKNSFF
jgi:hypothetical protein